MGGVISGVLNILNSRRLLKIATFQTYSRQFFFDDPDLKRIRRRIEFESAADLAEEDLYLYCGFFEQLGLFVKKGLVHYRLVKEIMGSYITEAHADARVHAFLDRKTLERNDNYAEFIKLAERISLEGG